MPFVNPETVIGEAGPVAMIGPGVQLTVYDVIGEPPSEAGGVKLTVAIPLPGIAVPIVGASGSVVGVTLFEAADAAPDPATFVATTVNVYAVPLASPFTMIDVQGAVQLPVMPEGDAVAV